VVTYLGLSCKQKDKSYSYGKVHKQGDDSLLPGNSGVLSENSSSSPRTDNKDVAAEEAEQDEDPRDSSFSFAESIFPISMVSNVSGGSAKKPQRRNSKSNDAGIDTVSENWSDQGSRKSFGPPSSVPEEDINIGPSVLKEYEDAEEDFLGDFEEYFENLSVDNVRKEQYPKLDLQRLVYLDYASCGLFSVQQVRLAELIWFLLMRSYLCLHSLLLTRYPC
jgi:hypothetical protein